MPLRPDHCLARSRVRPIKPALLELYAAWGAHDGISPSMLATLTMLDPGPITRPHAWAIQYAPSRLTASTRRKSAGDSRVAGTAVPTPALLIRTSTGPNRSIAAVTRRVQSSGAVTSIGSEATRAPAAAK